MSRHVEFLLGADIDLQDAFNRYEDYRNGLGAEFLTVVNVYLTRITIYPDIAPRFLGKIRRQVMRRFPYGIFYEAQPTRIIVGAIMDLRQDDRRILRRFGC